MQTPKGNCDGRNGRYDHCGAEDVFLGAKSRGQCIPCAAKHNKKELKEVAKINKTYKMKHNPALYIGTAIGNLTPIKFLGFDNSQSALYVFKCVCGNERRTRIKDVKNGKVVSCGCKRGQQSITHGLSKSFEYSCYHNMITRCYYTGTPTFKNYGGRGIKVCDKWLDKEDGFPSFIRDMGMSPSKKHSIERNDVNGNYTPENCRWATRKEQGANRRPVKSAIYPINGVKLNLKQVAEQMDVNYQTLSTSNNESKILFETQKDLFFDIWNSNPHKCEICEDNIPEPLAHNFAHIIPKGSYRRYKLLKKNIALLCIRCHTVFDFGNEQQRTLLSKYKGWHDLLAKRDVLKEEYYAERRSSQAQFKRNSNQKRRRLL